MKAVKVHYLILLVLLFLPISLFGKSRKQQTQGTQTVADMLEGLSTPAPALWQQGMPFIFMSDRIALSLIPEVPMPEVDTLAMKGTRWFYDSMVSEEDWMGQQLLQLRFISPQGRAYRYSTGKPMSVVADTAYHPAISVLYPEYLIARTDSVLRSNTLYILYNDDRITYPSDTLPGVTPHLKFIPVCVDSVTVGTEIAPLCVHFSGEECGYFFSSLPGSRQTSTSTPISRYLSVSDPYLLHPDITPEVWNIIKYSQVKVDMTSEEVRLAWGRPSRIESKPSRTGVIEYWYYSNNRILQIWDGRLSRIGIL